MEEFLRYTVGQLVEFPDDVVVTRTDLPEKTTFRLIVRKSDVPRVIGKSGHTIQALRSMLLASGRKKDIRTALEIIE